MLRTIARAAALLLVVALLAAAAGLAWAHLAIRRERPPLPAPEVVARAIASEDGPIAVSMIDTARQAMPRSAVLDPGRDPTPDAAYVMSHPSFVLEWADGRILLVDAGMTRDEAIAFGKPAEWVAGAEPIAPEESVAERLGPELARVAGAVFTHLHSDHVGGMTEICDAVPGPIRVLMSAAQAERPNYTTRPGRRLLDEVRCVRVEPLSGSGALPLPGFPGVAVIPVGGHTPGSQIVVASVGRGSEARRFVFTGDTVNAIDGIRHDVPKPFLYRLLIVPEDEDRQRELRAYLGALAAGGTIPLVSHDGLALATAGVPAWSPRPSTPTPPDRGAP